MLKKLDHWIKEIDGGFDVDEKMACIVLHSSLNEDGENKKIELFHIKVQAKKISIDTFF